MNKGGLNSCELGLRAEFEDVEGGLFLRAGEIVGFV